MPRHAAVVARESERRVAGGRCAADGDPIDCSHEVDRLELTVDSRWRCLLNPADSRVGGAEDEWCVDIYRSDPPDGPSRRRVDERHRDERSGSVGEARAWGLIGP